MKISKYTFFVEKHGVYCIYNTISNSFLSIEKSLYDQLKQLVGNKQFEESELNEDEENILLLKKGKFITDNDMDDFLQLKAVLNSIRRYNKSLWLTIAPTLDCNYSCYYCFEDHYQEYMTSEEIDAINHLINDKKDIDFLNITWFGGEPLMAVDKIVEFYQKFDSPIKNIHTSIITNGYYMTSEVVDMFEKNKFNKVQISIDGIENDYNVIKYSKLDKNCWDTIIENIDYLVTKEQISIVIRVNLQNNDSDNFVEILSYFKNRYPNSKNLFIAPAFLTANRVSEQKNGNDFLAEKKDKIEFELNMTKKALENESGYRFPFDYPSNSFHECAARNENSFGIGPGGLLYKCWENIGNKEETFGILTNEGKIEITNAILHNRYLYGEDPLSDSECQKCKYFPICVGNCPNWRLRNYYEDAKIDICTNFKLGLSDYLEKRIELYINQKNSQS